jgi:outer membrane biosynthesis protein TonB
MEIGGDGVGVYAEAKGEYTRQLCQFIVPPLQTFFLGLLDEAKEKEPEARKLLMSFQTLLEGIADWNNDKVQRETATIVTASHCDYMEELLTAVFIAHTKVLSAIRLTSRQKKLQITIPKLDHFIHRTMTECARLLWTNTYLFATSGASIERQKNMRLIEALINDGVNQAIRSMLPVKSILKEYLKDDGEEEGVEEEKVEEKAKAEEKVEEKAEEKVEEKAEPEQEEPKVELVEAKLETLAVEELKVEAPAPKTPSAPIEEANTPVTPAAPTTSTTPTTPTTPTIIVGSDNDSHVQFTGLDSVFDSENPEASKFKQMTEESDVITDDEAALLSSPPEPMDGFEDLGDSEILPMDGFEEL